MNARGRSDEHQSHSLFESPSIADAAARTLAVQRRGLAMADTTKLSPEKALEKLRSADALKSKEERRNAKLEELDEDIKRMRAQRLRLERMQRKQT
jgi:predicted nuclease with TOPRIM domain